MKTIQPNSTYDGLSFDTIDMDVIYRVPAGDGVVAEFTNEEAAILFQKIVHAYRSDTPLEGFADIAQEYGYM